MIAPRRTGSDKRVLLSLPIVLRSLVLVLLLLPAPAVASHPGPVLDNADSRQALRLAYDYFGGRPVGCSHVVLGTPPAALPGVAWGDTPGCGIWVTSSVYLFSGLSGWREFCRVIAHEVGHNLGLGHTTGVADSVMDTVHAFVPPNCLRRYTVLHRHRHRHRGRVHYHRHHHPKVARP